ncbi:CLPTM1-like membrane cnrB [Olea europaea subsp. europaea]|uniref:CLPTM1-like membrane cnrB n=1 Tax=Olea europaea subsp. europaea TaxID=158383 RepID=A0A8S0TLR1_OLEEU|nr:CLPTM1-like membrane cnrB [Olea europaea subsp. europaea]
MMCPQLFINYKLKSVAHLPWRQMTYKFLNTIIDDLFAFVIKMPTLHRLSVFRDDLIFLIYLYQRWVYPVDKKRVNEFGFAAEDDQASTSTDVAEQTEDEKKTN